MDQIAVLIPCYNEAQTIEKVIKDWKKVLPEACIYVYDNNSTDGTANIAQKCDVILRREPHPGKGNVIRRMFREVNAEVYIMVDGDDTYPSEYGREMIDLVLKQKADMVIGDRLSANYNQENLRPFHNFGNEMVRRLINHLFKSDVKDIMTGYRAFGYHFVKTFPVMSKGFEVETEMTIHALDTNMYVKSVVIPYRNRPAGSKSKLNTYSDGVRVLCTIGRLYRDYRPFGFYSGVSLLLFLVSTRFLLPVLHEYFRTGLVMQFPTLIVCGFVYIAAIISFFSGMILSSIAQCSKREFERALMQAEESYIRLKECEK